jgi:hypothetical protein
MPEFCTCGAQLPPDALFCHKCGKAQRDIIEAEPAPPPPPTVIEPPSPASPPAVNFQNRAAVRIALLVSIGAMFLNWLPLINWLGAGFFAVFFYRRKTRDFMDVGAGVKLGWITGVIMFSMWSVVFTAVGVTGKFGTIFQEQMKSLPANDPYVQQVVAFLQSPTGIVAFLAMGFMFITMLSMAGGALGAKMVGRD